MRKPLVLAVLCAVLVAVGAWQAGWLGPPSSPAVPPRPTPTPAPAFQSEWATEQDWIVDTITRDLLEMTAFAAGQPLPDGGVPAIRADSLSLEPHIFAPEVYAPLAAEVLAAPTSPSRRASSPAEDERLLEALLDLRAEVLVRESAKVSRRLEVEPVDPDAHERAALLLGAFALRDEARWYTDRRPALCRMAAHLSLARALRGGEPAGLAGRFGGVLLDSLVGRQRDALAALESLGPPRGRVVRAWERALRIQTTLDWRIARDARGLSLLEKLQEFKALAGLNDLDAVAWLDEQGTPEPIADWSFLAFSSGGSVQTYNRFAPMRPGALMAEAAAVWEGLDRPELEDLDRFLEALNARPGPLLERQDGGEVRAAVLGWGLWADRSQRHLLNALAEESYRLGAMLGQSGADEAFIEDARAFSRLDLFPLFLRNVETDVDHYKPAMAACRELALRVPERMTPGLWTMFRSKKRYADLPTDWPDEFTWFEPPLLPGTAMDFYHRAQRLTGRRALDVGRIRELNERAPYDRAIAVALAERQPVGQRAVADLVPVYGPLAEFDLYIMGKLSDAAWYDPPEFRRRQGAMCELVAEKCFLLGYRLAELGLPEEAADAYQSGFDRARDRVTASQETGWLVRHYLKTERAEKAEAVARKAASTHSAAGLLVLALVMEETGRPDEAESLYRQEFESYDEALPMAGFYYRQARVAGKASYEGRLRDALALAWPGGQLEPLDRADLTGPPVDGVVVKKENDNTKRYGIKWGHVIVGLDGFRVRDFTTYSVVRALSYAPQMKLVIWRGGSYDDVEVELWDRRFRVALEDLAPKEH